MRLMHPIHGWHVASQVDDIPAMRRNGWVEDDGKALAEKLAAIAPKAVENDYTSQRNPFFSEQIRLNKDNPMSAANLGGVAQLAAAASQPIKRGPGRPRKA